MNLTWNPPRRRFEARCPSQENHLALRADFQYDLKGQFWFTTNPRAAVHLQAWADADTRTRLVGVPPLPMRLVLYWHPLRQRFEAEGPRRQLHLPQEAGFTYDRSAKLWYTTLGEVAQKLSGFASPACLPMLRQAQEAALKLREQSSAEVGGGEYPCPPGLAYLPFQKVGIGFGLQVWGSNRQILIADEMGLGKTVELLGLINATPEIRRTVLICPANLKTNWAIEASRWLVRPTQIRIAATKRPTKSKWQYLLPDEPHIHLEDLFLIINYDILPRFQTSLRERPWDLLGGDEVHYLKGLTSIRSAQVFGKFQKNSRTKFEITPLPATRSALLTGTPIMNRPLELFPLIHHCDPDSWPHKTGFINRYCGWDDNGYGRTPGKGINLGELQERLRGSIMLRREYATVMKELPPKRRQILELPAEAFGKVLHGETAAAQAYGAAYLALQAALAVSPQTIGEGAWKERVGRLKEAARLTLQEVTRARYLTAMAKLPMILEHLRDLTDHQKVACFAYHQDIIQAIAKAFPGCAEIHGKVPAGEVRQRMVERFQQDPNCRLFLGSVLNAEGYTITATHLGVFAELDYRPGKIQQAEARYYRHGQLEPVLSQFPVLEGSIDARIIQVLVEKQQIIDAAGSLQDNTLDYLPSLEWITGIPPVPTKGN